MQRRRRLAYAGRGILAAAALAIPIAVGDRCRIGSTDQAADIAKAGDIGYGITMYHRRRTNIADQAADPIAARDSAARVGVDYHPAMRRADQAAGAAVALHCNMAMAIRYAAAVDTDQTARLSGCRNTAACLTVENQAAIDADQTADLVIRRNLAAAVCVDNSRMIFADQAADRIVTRYGAETATADHAPAIDRCQCTDTILACHRCIEQHQIRDCTAAFYGGEQALIIGIAIDLQIRNGMTAADEGAAKSTQRQPAVIADIVKIVHRPFGVDGRRAVARRVAEIQIGNQLVIQVQPAAYCIQVFYGSYLGETVAVGIGELVFYIQRILHRIVAV